MQEVSIYIHWPFCKSKCPYCDFNSHVSDNINHDDWERAYLQRITHYKGYISQKKIKSIFFGGGTPSLMPSKIVCSIINKLQNIANFADDIEISLEANPTSSNLHKFQEFSDAGVNRVSIGVQSLNDQDLKFLGREHNAKAALDTINMVASIYDNYSFDLIYNRPGQNKKLWLEELKIANDYSANHISLYQLTIEKGTKFYQKYQNNEFSLPDDDLSIDLYESTNEYLQNYGFNRYEVSNFAKKGYECKHNLAYWRYKEYLGIGAGAHSRVYLDDKNLALSEIYNPQKWLKLALNAEDVIQSQVILSKKEMFEEFLMMGLRLSKGINLKDIEKLLDIDVFNFIDKNALNYLAENNLIKFNKCKIYVTKKGNNVLNQIICKLIA